MNQSFFHLCIQEVWHNVFKRFFVFLCGFLHYKFDWLLIRRFTAISVCLNVYLLHKCIYSDSGLHIHCREGWKSSFCFVVFILYKLHLFLRSWGLGNVFLKFCGLSLWEGYVCICLYVCATGWIDGCGWTMN